MPVPMVAKFQLPEPARLEVVNEFATAKPIRRSLALLVLIVLLLQVLDVVAVAELA
jgi:hypothetical protein